MLIRFLKILFQSFVFLPCWSGQILQAQGKLNKSTSITKRIIGDPLEHLPKNIEVLTSFGERADISPDGKRVAFMSKAFGDAMLIDVQTRVITCLTCNIPAAGFLRVMHLSNGDYLLIGPDHFENSTASKKNTDVWYLSKEKNSRPVKIGLKVNEGLAISKTSLKIAFTETGAERSTALIVADLELSGGEQQRVDIARALLNSPKLILADEPTGNLDPETTDEIMNLLFHISRDFNTTIVMATHDYIVINKFPARTIKTEKGKVYDNASISIQ